MAWIDFNDTNSVYDEAAQDDQFSNTVYLKVTGMSVS